MLSVTVANPGMPDSLYHTFFNRCWLKTPVATVLRTVCSQNVKCKEGKLSFCPDSPIKEPISTAIMTPENWLSHNMNIHMNLAFGGSVENFFFDTQIRFYTQEWFPCRYPFLDLTSPQMETLPLRDLKKWIIQ